MRDNFIDEMDRGTARAIHADPTAAFVDIAAAVGADERTVARRYARLHRLGLVKVVGRTLPNSGGVLAWMVRARVVIGEGHAIARQIAGRSDTRWVRLTTDNSEIIFGALSRDVPAFDQLLAWLDAHPHIKGLTVHQLLRTWTAQGETRAEPARERQLDEVDHKILASLADDGRASYRSVARAIDVHPSTVRRRVEALREDGVLYFETELDSAALSNSVDFMCWVGVPPGMIQDVADGIAHQANVQFVAYTSGTTNLIFHALAPSVAEILPWIDEVVTPRVSAMEVQVLHPPIKRTHP